MVDTINSNAQDTSIPTVKPRMTIEQIEMLLAHIFLVPDIFIIARQQLKPYLFTVTTESHYRALWQVALNLVENKPNSLLFENKVHAYSIIEVTLRAYATANPEQLSEAYTDKLFSCDAANPGLLYWIYKQVNEQELTFHWGRELLCNFRTEREVHDKLRKAIHNAGDSLLDNLPVFLQKMHDKQAEIQATVDNDEAESGAPENWVPTPMMKFPTNVVYLDPFLRGGHAGKEVYGVLGAYGSGKTAMAIQLVSKGAQWQLAEQERDPNYEPKHCYLFTYEATLEECRIRLWAQECSIDHETLEEFKWENLSSMANGYESLKPYEKEYWAESIANNPHHTPQGELERMRDTLPNLRKNLWIWEMTSQKHAGRGTGYVPEIAAIIENDLRKRKEKDGKDHKVGVVAIDYVGLCVTRYMNAHNIKQERMRLLIKEFADYCKQQIAIPYNCPVWIFHQLSGEANKKTHATKQHYTASAESTGFAENLVFSFALGTKDPKHGVMQLTCSKARRASLGTQPLIMMEGQFFRLVPADNFVLGDHGEVIPKANMKKATANEVPQTTASPEPYKPSNHGGYGNGPFSMD